MFLKLSVAYVVSLLLTVMSSWSAHAAIMRRGSLKNANAVNANKRQQRLMGTEHKDQRLMRAMRRNDKSWGFRSRIELSAKGSRSNSTHSIIQELVKPNARIVNEISQSDSTSVVLDEEAHNQTNQMSTIADTAKWIEQFGDQPATWSKTGPIGSLTEASTLSFEMEKLRDFAKSRAGRTRQRSSTSTPKGVLAVFICGVLDRLILHSKIVHVVEPAVLDGYQVDVYLSVVKLARYTEFAPVHNRTMSPEAGNVSRTNCWEKNNLCNVFAQAVSSAGGKVILAEVLDTQIDVTTIANYPPSGKSGGRLGQYRPGVSEVGMNILRRFKWLESFANRTFQPGRVSPDFVLITRDDDHWLGPLRLSTLASRTEASVKVFTKDCKQFGGVNDHTLLLGRDAVSAILPRIYNGFWDQSNVLDSAFNVEGYLLGLVSLRNMISEPVGWELLPTVTSAYVKQGTLCRRAMYDCRWTQLDKMPEILPASC